MQALGYYSGEEVEVTFRATLVASDYGVPGSPVWDEVEDVAIDALTILGVEVDPKALPDKLYTAIMELADEVEWEE
jgi:hypothetical protein